MTRKYVYVREDVYRLKKSDSKRTIRTFAEMKKLFKPINWCAYLLEIILIILYFASFSWTQEKRWIYIIAMYIVAILQISLPQEWFLRESEYKKEKISMKTNYSNYVSDIKNIIKEHIESYEKFLKLKSECEGILANLEEKYNKVNKAIFELMIRVPIVAVIASIIYEDKNVVFEGVGIIVIIGIIIIWTSKAVKNLEILFFEYKKDIYLLNSINELDYSQKALDSIFKDGKSK